MKETYNKPVALENIDYVIWGNGNPLWSDPRECIQRLFSKHIVWLCRKKPMSAAEIADELNVPTLYVEEEMEILRRGANGKYGLLRRLDNGKYAINFILLDEETVEKAHTVYTERLPMICDTIVNYIEKHEKEYLDFPYLNKKVDLNLILWQQIFSIADCFSYSVKQILKTKYFEGAEPPSRPFSVFGYVDSGKRHWGGGWDGVDAKNVCGFSDIHLDNIYISRIKPHFHCGMNVSNNVQIQLALRAIEGLAVSALSEDEKEHAAKAIEQGYLYREGDTLYTKILVSEMSDRERLFDISNGLIGVFEKEAASVAEKIAALIRRSVPDHLLGEWRFANDIASMPILDSVVEALIEKGVLTPPENGLGAEGCWMSVKRA